MTRFAIALASLLCFSAPAFAQMGVGQGGGQGVGGAGVGGAGMGGSGMSPAGVPARSHGEDDDASPSKSDKPVEPPPAIPGAQPNEDSSIIPSDRVAAEMSPNDALFDAISRGDLAAAKDSLNRGAQLDAHNVLGQTPTDASIDLDRNDITFLLLSMRGAAGSSAPSRTASAPQTAPGRHKGGRQSVIQASAQSGQRTAHQRSADRGTPNPAVGFIGF